MDDTEQRVKDLQLKIWLSKSPAERLKQFMEDNAAMSQFWNKARKADAEAAGTDRES
jgi:hypothetical protein